VGLVALAAVTLVPRGAEAEGGAGAPCPVGVGAWLRVSFAGEGFVPPLQAQVAEQLGADLRVHHVELCQVEAAPSGAAPSGPPALADVGLSLSATRVLSLEVSDAVTDKRMTRQVPLASVPRDALALSIALAAQELLHASWIEAAFAPQASPASSPVLSPVPTEVQEMNRDQLARIPVTADVAGRSTPVWSEMALLAAADRATGGQTDLGADLRAAVGGRVAVEGAIGVRAAPDVTSAHGTVQGRELLAGAGVTWALMPRQAPWGLTVGARAELLDVEFSAVASPGARAASGSQLGAAFDGSIAAWWRLGGPWRLVVEAAAGAPLRAVTASDVGATASGVSGALIGATIGVAAALSE